MTRYLNKMPKIINIFIVLTILLLAGFFLLWPKWQELGEVQNGLADKKAELEAKAILR